MNSDIYMEAFMAMTHIISTQGRINLEPSDLDILLQDMQDCGNFYAEASGEDRSIDACDEIIKLAKKSKINMKLAKSVMIVVTGGYDVLLYEIDEVATKIKDNCRDDLNMIIGNTISNDIKKGYLGVQVLVIT